MTTLVAAAAVAMATAKAEPAAPAAPIVPVAWEYAAPLIAPEGDTFASERTLARGPAAYSDMALLEDRSVALLWEREDYAFITFARLDRAFFGL